MLLIHKATLCFGFLGSSLPMKNQQRHDQQKQFHRIYLSFHKDSIVTTGSSIQQQSEYPYDDDDNDDLANSKFGRQEYWNTIYKNQNEFSWYAAWDDIKPFFNDFVQQHQSSPRILLPGIGNDFTLIEKMYNDGYAKITAMDYAPEAIERCRDLLPNTILRSTTIPSPTTDNDGGIELVVADARNLNDVFDDNQFDVVFEKGTLDAIYLSGGTNKDQAKHNMKTAIKELCRCIEPGGIFISLAGVVPDEIQKAFQEEQNLEWDCLVDKDDLYITNEGYTSNNIDGTLLVWRKRDDDDNSDEESLRYSNTNMVNNKPDNTNTNDHVSAESRRLFLGFLLAMTLTGSSALIPEEVSAEDETTAKIVAIPTESLSSSSAASTVDWNGIFQKASKRAVGGGKAGAAAAVVQVLSLMWLRTSMNYQYAKGGNLVSSLKTLWNEGGIPRLYQGLPFALVQGPLTRFGDTAANVGILALLESTPETQALPLPIKTALSSISAGLWRIVLMPIDASKTAMQVEGEEGIKKLWGLVKEEGPAPLYYGAVAQASATAAGHFPWFLTYNFVDSTVPPVSSSDDLLLSLARSAFLGLCASCVSDITSNSLRVIKTTKQTARLRTTEKSDDQSTSPSETTTTKTTAIKTKDPSYVDVVKMIIEQDGLTGLFFRGLQTRLLTNAIQGAIFSVLWKYFQSQS
jgi:SAM-dependent methyltransferase